MIVIFLFKFVLNIPYIRNISINNFVNLFILKIFDIMLDDKHFNRLKFSDSYLLSRRHDELLAFVRLYSKMISHIL